MFYSYSILSQTLPTILSKDSVPTLYYIDALISEDGPTNIWMYAVIAAGSAFIIFVAVALYTVW